MNHEHNHEHIPEEVFREVSRDPVDPTETERLKTQAFKAGSASEGYFLQQAANSKTKYERAYWMRRVEGARHNIERQKARDKLAAATQRNLDADMRLEGTERSLEIVRIVGNAAVLKAAKLFPGENLKDAKQAPGGYSLVGRIAGRKGEFAWGNRKPLKNCNSLVVHGMQKNMLYEFCLVSNDDQTAKESRGPWLDVRFGSVDLNAINRKREEEARAEYLANESEEQRKIRESKAAAFARNRKAQEQLQEQQKQADLDNARRERERIEREKAHEKAVKELPLTAPREVRHYLDQYNHLVVSFRRGVKRCLHYRFTLNGSVMGDPPDGSYSGSKAASHRYERKITLRPGENTLEIAAVTNHGDSPETVIQVTKPSAESYQPTAVTRESRILDAIETFTGRRTRSGRPYVRDLRTHSGIKDITVQERNRYWRQHKGI